MQITSMVLPPQLLLSGSSLYASQGGIYALDANSGIMLQRYSISGMIYPAVADDVLYMNVSCHPDYLVQALRTSVCSTSDETNHMCLILHE